MVGSAGPAAPRVDALRVVGQHRDEHSLPSQRSTLMRGAQLAPVGDRNRARRGHLACQSAELVDRIAQTLGYGNAARRVRGVEHAPVGEHRGEVVVEVQLGERGRRGFGGVLLQRADRSISHHARRVGRRLTQGPGQSLVQHRPRLAHSQGQARHGAHRLAAEQTEQAHLLHGQSPVGLGARNHLVIGREQRRNRGFAGVEQRPHRRLATLGM